MYEYIKGAIAELTPAYAVIEAGGVGYYLTISLTTYSELQKTEAAAMAGLGDSHVGSGADKTATVYTHFVVREDAQLLYGFSSRQERELFRQLIGVSGVGGNTARMILSTYSPRDLVNIIASRNDTLLRNVKGLGVKTAQKIIVELRDKVTAALGASNLVEGSENASGVVAAANSAVYEEALAALTMLGFARAASGKVVSTILADNPLATIEEVVRLSLKKL